MNPAMRMPTAPHMASYPMDASDVAVRSQKEHLKNVLLQRTAKGRTGMEFVDQVRSLWIAISTTLIRGNGVKQ